MNQQARIFAQEWAHMWYGFWGLEETATGRKFSLADHSDPSWAPPDITNLVAYLRTAPSAIAAQQPPAKCGFCKELLFISAYRSDGTLLWPDSLAHLVEKHSFVLPDNWIEHIRSANYTAPSELNCLVEELPWPSTI